MIKAFIFCSGIILSSIAVQSMQISKEIKNDQMDLKPLLLFLKQAVPPRTTTSSERRQYGFNGTITRMYKLINKHKFESTGCIIWDAQPSTLFGYWYLDSHVFSNRLYLEDNKTKYEALIKERTSDTAIGACCLTDEDKIAIQWEDMSLNPQKKLYITMASIAEIKSQDNQIDLDKNKVEIGFN